MFEDSSSLIGRIRSRYQIIYADDTRSDWMTIPDPEHPAFSFGEDWDESEGPKLFGDEYERIYDEAKHLNDIDMEMLEWFFTYVSGFHVTVPVEYNERKVGENRFECDIQPYWILSYSYVPEEMAFRMDGLRRSDAPCKKVKGVDLVVMLSDEEHRALQQRFQDDRRIELAFINSISEKYHSKPYDYSRYKVGECRIPVSERGGNPVHELHIRLSNNQFYVVQQMAYGNPRDIGDLMV